MNDLAISKGTTQTRLDDLVLFKKKKLPLHIHYRWTFPSPPKKALHTQVKCEVLETLFIMKLPHILTV